MAKFVYVYHGGSMAPTPEEQEAAMQRWMAGFGTLGSAVADHGNPFGASTSVGAGGGLGATGYSIVTAESLESAATLAKGCPIIESGGSVAVYEALEM